MRPSSVLGTLQGMKTPVQETMFGVQRSLDMHVVAAHTRVLQDGTETFVGEHLRWNRRGTEGPTKPRPRKQVRDPGQLGLFGAKGEVKPPAGPVVRWTTETQLQLL